jgi:hypothetical protein
VHEIVKVAGRCLQVIVLSHDATFLKQVGDKAPAAERVALTIADHRSQGSKIPPMDLERACQGRTATDIDDLQTYLTTGAGGLIAWPSPERVRIRSRSNSACENAPNRDPAPSSWHLLILWRKCHYPGGTIGADSDPQQFEKSTGHSSC